MTKSITKKFNKKNIVVYAMIALCVVVVIILSVVSGNTKKAKLPGVAVETAKTGNVTEKVDTSGNVESQNKKTFFSPVNAEIAQLNFSVGDSVVSGELLVSYNLENLEKDNQKAELTALAGRYGYQDTVNKANEAAGKKSEAASKVNILQNQVDNQKQYIADLQAAIQNDSQAAQDKVKRQMAEAEAERQAVNTQIQNQIGERQAALAAADEALKQAQKNHNDGKLEAEKKKNEFDAAKSLGDAGKITAAQDAYNLKLEEAQGLKDVMDQAQNAADATQKEIDALIAQLSAGSSPGTGDTGTGAASASNGDLTIELQNAQSELAELQSDLASNKAVSETDAGSMSSDQKSQLQINNNLQELDAKSLEELIEEGRTGIAAEFTGVVSDAKVVQGTTVAQGMELFTLQSTEDVNVNISVSKYDYDKVKEGQKAKVTVAGKDYDGTVTKINKIAIPNEKGTPVIGASVHIDNPDQDIFIGVEAKVSIQAAEATNVTVVPVEVVNTGNEGSFCYIVENEKVVKKNIETGVASDSYIEIKKGLKAGDAVISDIGSLKEGDKVKAVESKESGASDNADANESEK